MDWINKRLPIIIFILMYFFTGYIASIILLFGSDSYWAWFQYFSGVTMPEIYMDDLVMILLLLHIPPILMWLGYESYIILKHRIEKGLNFNCVHIRKLSHNTILIFFMASVIVAIISVVRSGSFQNFSAWMDYNQWVHARFKLFEKLNFFEFVNIYSLMPLLGAIMVIYNLEGKNKALLKNIGIILPIILINSFIYQKKSLITSLIIILFSIYIYYYLGQYPRKNLSRRGIVFISSMAFLIYLIYAIMVVLPVISEKASAYKPTEELVKAAIEKSSEKKNKQNKRVSDSQDDTHDIFKKYETIIPDASSRGLSLFLYTFMAPINRTSVSNIVYPIVFPKEHEYYHLDLGQDIAGFGSMPDDFIVVWNKTYPKSPGGTATAPFHIVLYSQGGLWVASIGAFITGFIISGGWYSLCLGKKTNIVSSVIGSMCILFSIFIAIDSLRNSITVSYGLLWPSIILTIIFFKYKRISVKVEKSRSIS